MVESSICNNFTIISPSNITEQRKKKPPACDSCKAKRVLCHRQPNGSPCPRCLEKGIACKTTPVVRRKPTRKVTAAIESSSPARAASSSQSSSSTPGPASSSPSRDNSCSAPFPSVPDLNIMSQISSCEVYASLVRNLLEVFQRLHHYNHPAIPVATIHADLHLCSFRLAHLPLRSRVLVHAILAVSALYSSDTLIIGHPAPAPSYPYTEPDLREYGAKREGICNLFRSETLKLAREDGVTTEVSQENAAACLLLDFLEARDDKGSRLYASAFVAHTRDLIDESPVYGATSIKWSMHLMINACSAILINKPLPFSSYDECLLCGDDPPSMNQILANLMNPEWLSREKSVFDYLRPYSFHVTRLAREGYECLTGVAARRKPFNETLLLSHLTSLDALRAILDAIIARIHLLLPGPNTPFIDRALRSCLFTASLAWAALVHPVYLELKRRLAVTVVAAPPFATADHSQPSLQRMELLFQGLKRMAVTAALDVARNVRDIQDLSFITHLRFVMLDVWARVLIDERETAALMGVDRIQALQWILRGLKLRGWSHVDRSGIIEAVEQHMREDVEAAFRAIFDPQLLPISPPA